MGDYRWNWRRAARCRTSDAEELFVTGSRQREARAFCRACPVRTECLAHALDQGVEFGIWGGMTERERRALLRSRPEVRSWYHLLADARLAHYDDIGSAPLGGGGDLVPLQQRTEQAVAERTAQQLSESA